MPNWSLAACGDWLHYKEATTVSCWCLTCKSCQREHTLWSRKAVRSYASIAHMLEKQLSEDVQEEMKTPFCVSKIYIPLFFPGLEGCQDVTNEGSEHTPNT